MNKFNGDRWSTNSDPVAIIGMACTLPGDVSSPDGFFDFLLRRRSGIREIPGDRWSADLFHDPNPDSIARSVSKWGGFISDIRGFDARFFGISPREAAGMDPQQRLVLTAAVDAMMDAQIPLDAFSRSVTGVFIGISQAEYRTLQEMRITMDESYAGTGYALCINANRVSHRLNLRGPSYAVDTACSSSLTALDQAIRNLQTGVCDMALVGGVNALTHPSSFLAFSKAGMISPSGRISTFDASANGFVRGEGVGMVVLKPLSRALADGNRVHAVVLGSHVNQDGATNTITAPSQQAQIAMLRDLLARTGIRADQIGFVEAHGTGTPIGDPIEAGAIGTVIGQATPDRPVFVGSVKANVGHLESGAGITGLIKAALAVRAGVVPPNINFRTPNPHIPFDALNLQVPVEAQPFPESDGQRYAIVNSFGFGGANASALVASAPAPTNHHHPVPALPAADARQGFPMIFPVSGATEAALQANAAALLAALSRGGQLADCALPDVAAALATRRSHLQHRVAILARDGRTLRAALRQVARGEAGDNPDIISGQARAGGKICFTFSGQGSQWWAMARDLLLHDADFAAEVDAYDALFRPVAGWSIRDELLKDEADSRINDTTVTQPALFAIQAGLAAVWRRMGVRPDMVVGHSIGEAAASYVAGGLSLDGAARFLSKRGLIRDQLGAKGAMAAIGLHHDDIEAILPLHGLLGIAAINGPGSTTISGDHDALHAFVEEFRMLRPDTFIRVLEVDTAWHSYQLEAGEAWFRREAGHIDWSVPRIPFISSVTGRPETRFDTDYGWLNLRRPVRYQAAVETALAMGATTFVELGPAATLAGPTRSTALDAGAQVSVLASLSRKDSNFDTMARAAAALFVQGHALDWAVIAGRPAAHVPLPGYAWQPEPFWRDSEESRHVLLEGTSHPFLRQSLRGAQTSWTSEVNLAAYPYLREHRLQAEALFPAAGYLDMIIAMGRRLFGADAGIEIEDAVIHEALFIGDEQSILLQTSYDAERRRVRIHSHLRDSTDDWVLRAEARIRPIDVAPPPPRPIDLDRDGLTRIDVSYVYDVDGNSDFINYGPSFQTVTGLAMSANRTFARIERPALFDQGPWIYHANPTMLDGCLQILEPRMTLKRVGRGRRPGDPVTMPVGLGRMRVWGDFPTEIFVEADQMHVARGRNAAGGFTVRDAGGRALMVVEGLSIRLLPAKAAPQTEDGPVANVVRQDIVQLRDVPCEPGEPGRWIILGTGSDADATLAGALRDGGAAVDAVRRDDLGADIRTALVDLCADAIETGALQGIVVTWPLALPVPGEYDGVEAVFAPLDAATRDLIALGDLMDYARSGTRGLPRIVLVTSGAYPDTAGGCDARILMQMPMAAVLRGLATETPEYTLRLIDADAAALSSPDELARRILGTGPETELILAQDRLFAPRLRPVEPADIDPRLLTVARADESLNFQATMSAPGIIDNVELREIPLEPLRPGAVRVRVSAVGLNFRDVMAVTGLLPIEAEPEPAWENLGLEFGGEVVAVGDGVTGFRPGDRVMGMGKRCLQRFMVVDAQVLSHVPDHITLAEASTIPSAFATAHYALNHVGRMGKGDKVLIHVATGGVGTAAVQLAQATGAEIFATAGSPAKRRRLRDLGVPHVMDSRSLKFADDVMRITKGRGVDILLNSLPGDYIAKGLDIMAPYGRFLEIGKRDVYADSAVGMKALRRNVSLSVLDLAAMGMERPDLMARLFEELLGMIESGALTPLPLTEFPISRIGDAIRYMSQARHVGKVVVTLEEDSFRIRRDADRPAALSADGSYLVTGGTAGFTLSMADWLSRAGAGRVVLTSRSGRIDAAGERQVAKMRARGTEVELQALDVTDEAALNGFVAACQASDRPLRGVLHGAAVIRDGFANQLSDEMITEVLSPKVRGAWALQRALAAAGVNPDLFVGFSSISQAIGSAGQSNYIAANAFLDALAHYRRSRGQSGTAIDWGVIADAGFVSRNAALASYLESVGLPGLRRRETPMAMELAATRDIAAFIYSRADWQQVARANAALGQSPRLASTLRSDRDDGLEARSRLMQLEGDDLVAAALDFIIDELTGVLKIDRASVQPDRPMSELGLDSLSSFELKVRIETALNQSLPVSRFLQAPSPAELAVILGEEIGAMKRSADADAAAAGAEGSEARSAAQNAGLRATNLQTGLWRDAGARSTSDHARRAMEHVASLALPADPGADALRAAFDRVVARHPLLTLVPGDDGRLAPAGVPPRLVMGDDDAPLDIGAGEVLRLSADGPRLGLRLHAVAGDAASAGIILGEIATLLSGGTLPRPMARRSLMAMIAACAWDADTPQGQTDRSFWWYGLSGGAGALPFARRSRALVPPALGRDRGAAGHLDLRLTRAPGDDAGVMIALAGALRDIAGGKGPVLMGRRVSLRPGLRGAVAVGPFVTEQPFAVPFDPADATGSAHLRRMLAAAPQHLSFDSHAAAAEFAPTFADWGVSPFQVLVEPDADLAAPAPAATLHEVWLRIGADGAAQLVYDRDVLSESTAQEIAAALSERAGAVSAMPPVTV